MFERIYAWLLRLYPSHFRKAYGDEALQLLRDRVRDERGFLPRLRLWLDLVVDLAVSIPQEYRHVQPVLAGVSVQQRFDGLPSFYVLGGESPRFGALLFGCALSLAALCAFPTLLSHVGNHRPQQTSVQPTLRQDAAAVTNRAAAEGVKLDSAERQRVIGAVIANLKQFYTYPDVAQKIADALLAHQNGGDYDALTDGEAFANLLTKHLRDVSADMHLVLVYSQTALPPQPAAPTSEDLARYRKEMEQVNCTFEKVGILPHNIGYLKLNAFPDPSVCAPTARAALASLNHVDAIIFDLRANRGGEPDMVALIAAYLFDHPEYWYNPRENTTQQSWTRSPVPGNSLADKQVYILTSARTLSGAEQFCYDLKMLKRAMIVGETTGGAAHSGVWHRIDDHFGMGVPETRPINPFAKTDWEGTGVEPDVKVKAPDALETAKKLAQSRLQEGCHRSLLRSNTTGTCCPSGVPTSSFTGSEATSAASSSSHTSAPSRTGVVSDR